MDKAMSADLDRHLTTEPENDTVEYDVEDVPVLQALALMGNSPSSPDDWGMNDIQDPDERRKFIYRYYQSNDMAGAVFSVGWERGVERQQLRLIEADEVNEGDELDDEEARWHYTFAYLAGQVATYSDPMWGTPYAMTLDDSFYEEVDE